MSEPVKQKIIPPPVGVDGSLLHDHARRTAQDGSHDAECRADVRQWLAGRHVACDQCGYDLCDLQSDRCPECGSAIRLQMSRADSNSADSSWAWAVGFVGLILLQLAFLAFDMLSLWFTYGFRDSFLRGNFKPLIPFLIVVALNAIPAVQLWVWITYQRKIERLRPAWRLTLAVLLPLWFPLIVVGYVVLLIMSWPSYHGVGP